jgi:nucleoside-diphosphate-sugar epimerase
MKIALTGATGFLGGPVMRSLLLADHELSVLARNPAGLQLPRSVEVVQGDIADKQALTELVSNADGVVHMAGAIAAHSEADYFKVNFVGTRNVFEAAMAAGVKRFIYVSSLAARMPNISPYAASKRAAEDFLTSVKSDLEIVILRPCAVYGPRDKATLPLLAALQKRVSFLPGLAKGRFSLLHVDDFAQVVVSSVASSDTGLFEVDDMDGGHSWAELASINFKNSSLPQHIAYLPKPMVWLIALFAELGPLVTGRPGLLNREKVRELYHNDWVVHGKNWPRSNAIGLEVGLHETLNWYRSEGLLPRVALKNKSTP